MTKALLQRIRQNQQKIRSEIDFWNENFIAPALMEEKKEKSRFKENWINFEKKLIKLDRFKNLQDSKAKDLFFTLWEYQKCIDVTEIPDIHNMFEISTEELINIEEEALLDICK
jgi:hypothetical protein